MNYPKTIIAKKSVINTVIILIYVMKDFVMSVKQEMDQQPIYATVIFKLLCYPRAPCLTPFTLVLCSFATRSSTPDFRSAGTEKISM